MSSTNDTQQGHAPEHVTAQAPRMSPCPDPWAHVRAHAAEGGLYASCIVDMLNRIQRLESGSDFKVLPIDRDEIRGEIGPYVLVPARPERISSGPSPARSLKEELREALADANGNLDWSWEMEADAVLRTVAAWLERGRLMHAAELLEQEANRG